MSENTPAPTVWGTFQARDARAMIDFLVALGFEETAVYGDGDCASTTPSSTGPRVAA